MRLSKQITDAIRILATCHRAGGKLVKVGDIASELGLTKQVALKTANALAQAELIETVRGPHGGIRLPEGGAELTIGVIVRALEGVPARGARHETENFGVFLDDAFEAFLDVLDRHKLSDFAGDLPVDRPAKRSRRAPDTRRSRPGRISR